MNISLPNLFLARLEESKNDIALFKDHPFVPVLWHEFGSLFKELSAGLIEIGLQKGDRASIISRTKMEWAASDLAIMCAGGITATVYYTCPTSEIAYLLKDSGSCFVFVENKNNLSKTLDALNTDDMKEIKSNIKGICVFDSQEKKEIEEIKKTEKILIFSFDELRAKGKERLEKENDLIEKTIASIKEEDTATIVYTSGTSGNFKGVVLTHKNLISQIAAMKKRVPITYNEKKFALFAFLTSAHIFQRVAGDLYFLSEGCPVYYCPRIEKVGNYLRDSEANVILVVPMFFEKIKTKIETAVSDMSPRRRTMFSWALKKATEIKEKQLNSEKISLADSVLLDGLQKVLFRPIRNNIGKDLKFFISGGAPLSKEVFVFFEALGFRVIEGYGLTECSSVIAANTLEKSKIGSVGPALDGAEIRISPEDEEVQVRGKVIFREYWNLPKETEEAFTEDGYFRTGDLGRLDEDNFLFITGRKKDLIVLSSGKKVSPALIEETMKGSLFIDQVAIFGDDQRWLGALITLNKLGLLKHLGEFKDGEKITEKEWKELVQSERIKKIISEDIKKRGERLAEYERIKRFKILENSFSHEKGEMSHTLKLKRNVIQANYAKEIAELFNV